MMTDKIKKWIKNLVFGKQVDLGFVEELNKRGIGVYY